MKRFACLALAALVMAACGGSGDARLSKSRYETTLHSAFVAAQIADDAAHHGGSNEVKVLKLVAETYADLAAALRDTRAPAAVQKLNDQLVAGASAEAGALSNLASKLERTPKKGRSRVLSEFDAARTPGQRQFDSAVAALEAKGYRFRPNAGR
jgi:hypothetical protein